MLAFRKPVESPRACPACDEAVAVDARRCGRCGTVLGPVKQPARPTCRLCTVVAALSIGLMLFWLAVFLLESGGF